MIVRILGEGQYLVPDGERDALAALDSTMDAAVSSQDERAFASALTALIEEVRRVGQSVADDEFATSDLVVPFADATLAETEGLLAEADEGAGTDEG